MDSAAATRLRALSAHLTPSASCALPSAGPTAAPDVAVGPPAPVGPHASVPQRFVGKYAIVTGASKGIGAAIAVRLAREGAHVCIVYGRDKAGAERTVTAIMSHGIPRSRTLVLGADMGDTAQIDGLFDAYFAHWPRLDVCIPNAAVQNGEESDVATLANFNKVIDINLKGYFLCAQRALKHFLAREGGPRGGVIVFDSSVHQIIPKPTYVGYAASKAAIGHMTATLALEYAGRGIRVNAIGPGAIATPMNQAWIDDPVKKEGVCSHIPQNRPGTADEIAAVFAFMASDDASYIVGQTLYACGGLTLYPEFRTAWASE